MITLLHLQAICNSKRPEIAAIYPFLISAMQEGGVDTPLRQAMFLAQGAHETGGFRWLIEQASGQAYEGRANLGNTEPGDGVKYRGRGVFQMTGRSNYARCSKALFGVESRLIDNPELLAQPEYAARSAVWYWNWKGLNSLADAADIDGVTKKINGGLNGIADRRALYSRAKLALSL